MVPQDVHLEQTVMKLLVYIGSSKKASLIAYIKSFYFHPSTVLDVVEKGNRWLVYVKF